ncbi:MAG: hypothetical protein NTX53_19195 [candidate division WOR-3 bacterium]|nr:hypothetical protein [candidate division WOR-3 bacterium]
MRIGTTIVQIISTGVRESGLRVTDSPDSADVVITAKLVDYTPIYMGKTTYVEPGYEDYVRSILATMSPYLGIDSYRMAVNYYDRNAQNRGTLRVESERTDSAAIKAVASRIVKYTVGRFRASGRKSR